MPAVSNTTPLIFLAKIGRLKLLRQLYEMVYVPSSVWRETVQPPITPIPADVKEAINHY